MKQASLPPPLLVPTRGSTWQVRPCERGVEVCIPSIVVADLSPAEARLLVAHIERVLTEREPKRPEEIHTSPFCHGLPRHTTCWDDANGDARWKREP